MQSEGKLEKILAGASKNMDLLGYERTNTPYVRRFTEADVKIDDDQVVEALEAFYTSDRSLDSFRAALDDAVRMASSVLGRAIDMAKNGDPVTTGLLAVLVGKDLHFEAIRKKGVVRFFCLDKVGVSCSIAQHEEGSSVYTMEYVVADYPDVRRGRKRSRGSRKCEPLDLNKMSLRGHEVYRFRYASCPQLRYFILRD